jgi:tetratricopeptide (TPR) repeat protein
VRIAAFLLVVCFGLLVATPPAWAEADEAALARARKAFKKGQKLYDLGKFEEALAQYEKAYEESELPELLFNIGQCHRNLDHYDEATFSFKKYLRYKPDADNRDAVEKLIVELQEAKKKAEASRPRPTPKPQRLDPIPRNEEVTPTPQPVYEEDSPFYARWWFWTGLAVAGGAVAAGVFLLPSDGSVPSSDLGNVDFPR